MWGGEEAGPEVREKVMLDPLLTVNPLCFQTSPVITRSPGWEDRLLN